MNRRWHHCPRNRNHLREWWTWNGNNAPGWSAGGAILKMVDLLGEDSNRIFETLLEWEEHLKPFRDELKAVGLMDTPKGPGL